MPETETSPSALLTDSTGAPSDSLGDDILRGAKAIGDFLGEPDPKRVYYAAEHKIWPIGHLGSTLIASKTALRQRYDQLTRGTAEPPLQPPAQTVDRRRLTKPLPPRRNRPRRRSADRPIAEA